MADPALKVLRLAASLRYRELPLPASPGFPFDPSPRAADGEEELALFGFDSVVRRDPDDGPRAVETLPVPLALARGVSGGESPSPAEKELELGRGAYAFLQGRASTEEELVRLLEDFARQAWWERMDCRGPCVVRRVFEDGRWATQVWRRLERA